MQKNIPIILLHYVHNSNYKNWTKEVTGVGLNSKYDGDRHIPWATHIKKTKYFYIKFSKNIKENLKTVKVISARYLFTINIVSNKSSTYEVYGNKLAKISNKFIRPILIWRYINFTRATYDCNEKNPSKA